MRFADSFSVTCPVCHETGNYSPQELVALRGRCERCSASLESVGRRMRAKLTESNAYFACMELAVELEEFLGVTVTEADLDAMTKPSDLVQFYSSRSKGQTSVAVIENHVVTVLARMRRVPVDANDLQRRIDDLFSVESYP